LTVFIDYFADREAMPRKRKAAAIRYEVNGAISLPQLREIYTASGLVRPVEDARRIRRMRDGANLWVTAWEGLAIVGVVRALTDGAFCCYVSDVGVRRDYQRKGIGREMLRRLRAQQGDEVMVLLLANPNARDYYGKVGFHHVGNAWKISRAR
jgi:GNAT superfamily N-acetyltransferase